MWEEFTSQWYWIGVWFEIEMWQIAVIGQQRRNRSYNQYSPTYICVCVLWTSIFLWRFGDNKNVVLFSTTLLNIRISFSDKLGLHFTVSQQFTSNLFRLQVLHYIFKPTTLNCLKSEWHLIPCRSRASSSSVKMLEVSYWMLMQSRVANSRRCSSYRLLNSIQIAKGNLCDGMRFCREGWQTVGNAHHK